jgi:hypothetical protein
MLDYLRYLFNTLDIYEPCYSMVSGIMDRTAEYQVIDLCSGGGGPMENMLHHLRKQGLPVTVILTDKFPSLKTFRYLQHKTGGRIHFHPSPVDAMNVPRSLTGIRTIFSGFHHFDESVSVKVLKDAVDARQPIAVFDGGDRNLLIIAGILLHPVLLLVFTPFMKPFRWKRLLFTYLIPVIPFCVVWDGIVSIWRLYDSAGLWKTASLADPSGIFNWSQGKKKNRWGMNITYLLGWPKELK